MTLITPEAGEAASADVTSPIAHTIFREQGKCASLAALAQVEVQSIMQLLDRTSLLRLARCSHRIYADADAVVVWQHQPAIEVKITPGTLDVVARIQRSLTKHIPGFSVTCPMDGLMNRDAQIDMVLQIPRITRLAINGSQPELLLTRERWSRIMQHEAIDGLRELITHGKCELPAGFVDQLVRLPHLHTLRVEGRLPDGDQLIALPRLEHLTTLQLLDLEYGATSRIPVVAECTHLTDLRLFWPVLYDQRFCQFFTSVNIALRLERLTIGCFHPRGLTIARWPAVPEADFAKVFQTMTRLRHLYLQDIFGVDIMLPGVARAPVLKHLVIGLSRCHLDEYSSTPSAAAVEDLLHRAPNLRVLIERRPNGLRYAELRNAHPNRLQVIDVVP